MEYPELNKVILTEWKNASSMSEYFIMNYDEEFHNKVLSLCDISKNDYWSIIGNFGDLNWRAYNKTIDGIPQVFGIIGCQIYVSSSMSGIEYNSLLANFLNLRYSDLKKAYEYSQDKIWRTAKQYIDKLGYKSTIPKSSEGPYRYVNYPKSQVYLRTVDLEKLYPFINDKLSHLITDEVCLDDFILEAKLDKAHSHSIPFKYRSSNFNQKYFSTTVNKVIIYNQIYNFFNEHYSFKNKDKSVFQPKLYFEEKGKLFLDNKKDTIDLDTSKPLKDQLNKYLNKVSDIYFLEFDYQYGDYEQVSKPQLDTQYYLLINMDLFLFQRLKGENVVFNEFVDFASAKIYINNENKHLFEKYISKNKTKIRLIGGIKVSRTSYLHNYGPKFKISEPLVISINGEAINIQNGIIDLSDLPPGHHLLKIGGQGKRVVNIIEAPHLENTITLQTGININSFEIGGIEIIGQNIEIAKSYPTTRDFIKSNLDHTNQKNKTELFNNLVMLNLIRAKNGSHREN